MSNFHGWLIKFGDDEFPHEYIIYDSYVTSPNRRFDLDSTRNANGVLTRYVLDHTASTLQFDIRPTNGDQQYFIQNFIRSHYVLEQEKRVMVTYWCPDIADYKQGVMYIPDIEWKIRQIKGDQIWYRSVTIKMIEY